MAKGLNLTDTNIVEFYMLVKVGGADVRVLYDIRDDNGDIVKHENYLREFKDLPIQVKAALNNALRLMSKEINNLAVSENKESWTDL